jgi:hypothetical protein
VGLFGQFFNHGAAKNGVLRASLGIGVGFVRGVARNFVIENDHFVLRYQTV